MAKTTGALMSMVASGKFASSIVYDKRGRARAYVIPANPQSTGQGDVRQKLATAQAVLKGIQASAITAIKAVAPVPSQWNSYSVQQVVGSGGANWTADDTTWDALAAGDRTAWDTAFAAVIVPDITYKLMADVTSGEAGWHVASALYRAGILTATGAPAAGNSAAWEAALMG